MHNGNEKKIFPVVLIRKNFLIGTFYFSFKYLPLLYWYSHSLNTTKFYSALIANTFFQKYFTSNMHVSCLILVMEDWFGNYYGWNFQAPLALSSWNHPIKKILFYITNNLKKLKARFSLFLFDSWKQTVYTAVTRHQIKVQSFPKRQMGRI